MAKMDNLYQRLKIEAASWKKKGYPSEFPAISEILKFNQDKFLRKAQAEALETYWFLRLIEKTPHIFDLYQKHFRAKALLSALNIDLSAEDWQEIALAGGSTGVGTVIEKIKTDNAFVKKYKLEGLRETLNIDYPSYILALAMGAGKTILISSIIATEFAMALEYPDGPFVKNALVFAPGKTILGALREVAETPFEKILPSRFYKSFITNVKFTYTRDGERDIPVIRESTFNVVVTNTEKIRLTKGSILKSQIDQLSLGLEEARELIANQRLQTLTSLPNLAVFSDEAHHTYGQRLEQELKRVRQTINYLNQQTSLVVVANTTGTPYYKRQLLKDVVNWYGLSQGIEDGILKEVRNNIVAYPDVTDKVFITDAIEDFFTHYRNVKIHDGSPARLAIYFPKIADLKKAQPLVEQTLLSFGIKPSVVLAVHNKSPEETKDLFDNRINDPKVPYRVFLLVNKGTEGWNCPSLFATALARKLRTSNNFVLQAASRCLRQTPGNTHKAKIYLSRDNVPALDKQLQETFGETLADLNQAETDSIPVTLRIRKVEIEPLVIKKIVQKFVPVGGETSPATKITKPKTAEVKALEKEILTLTKIKKRGVLTQVRTERLGQVRESCAVNTAAVLLAEIYRLDSLTLQTQLNKLYPSSEIPLIELESIRRQVEDQVCRYKAVTETLEEALAIIKTAGFNTQEEKGKTTHVTEIRIRRDRLDDYVLNAEDYKKRVGQLPPFGFHYTPYNFDSKEEREFFEQLLSSLGENPDAVEDIYYTGALTDREKTDFIFEIRDEQGDWHYYTPDFLIRKKNGKSLIVEVKARQYYDVRAKEAGRRMKELEGVNKDKIKYEILLLEENEPILSKIKPVKDWVYKRK